MPRADSYSVHKQFHLNTKQYLMTPTHGNDSSFTMYAIVPLAVYDFNKGTDKGILPRAHSAFSQSIFPFFEAGFQNFLGMT